MIYNKLKVGYILKLISGEVFLPSFENLNISVIIAGI
jgi:hypothetical protein